MEFNGIADQSDINRIALKMKPEKGALLKRFFGNAPDWVLRECQYTVIKKNIEFVREEQPAHTVYILVSGSVNATDYRISDTAYSFKTYHPLVMFGDMEVIIRSQTYVTTLLTCSDCGFITLPMKTYEKWMRQDHEAFWIQTQLMTDSFLRGARKDRSFLFLDATERMHVFFTNLYESNARDGELHVKLTRKNLADEIGCSVRTVNRALMKMKEKGCLQVNVSHIMVSQVQYQQMKQYIDEKISEM